MAKTKKTGPTPQASIPDKRTLNPHGLATGGALDLDAQGRIRVKHMADVATTLNNKDAH